MNANDYPYSLEPQSQYQMVREWLEAFGKPLDQSPNQDLIHLAGSCIIEESDEVYDEMYSDLGSPSYYAPRANFDKEKLTKELCDLLWVTYQAAAFFGLPIEQAFRRVYESNMSKLGDDGKPVLREDGKILKGPNYKPANLGDLFDDGQTKG